MKIRFPRLLLPCALLLAGAAAIPLVAQGQAPAAALTRDERQRLKTAHEAAMSDEVVQKARSKAEDNPQAFEQTVRAAMLRRDPSLGPLLDKARAGLAARGERAAGQYSFLSEAEKKQLRQAHQKAAADPAVADARKQLEAASTPAAKRQTAQTLREATSKAMLQADPSISALLEKIRQRAPDAGQSDADDAQ